ncbi:Centromere protein I [Chionoecetes opilio]|uniref:Centromere protein I n=1 Tax=Chionoecetes opilio TaxID=41210 RepID=A0A8J5CUP8_CHIOP|nr:Centromere protein I [Chionoecetes opilio]
MAREVWRAVSVQGCDPNFVVNGGSVYAITRWTAGGVRQRTAGGQGREGRKPLLYVLIMAQEEMEKALDYLVKNAGRHSRDLARDAVKQAVIKVEEAALQGLPATTITTLAQKLPYVLMSSAVVPPDQLTRRRLLYCLVPEGQDFPLQVVPLAVSSAAVHNISVAWQHAVLSWLEGMLEYGIIAPAAPLVHICYTTIFNLTSCLSLSSVACRLLYHITVRSDVTSNRIHVLLRLKLKPAFRVPVSYLLRLYHLFRPDMVVGRIGDRSVVIRLSPGLKARLLEARTRLQSVTGDMVGLGKDRMWRDGLKVERVNVYQRNTAVPQPQFNIYTTKVEENKGRVIYVTQYQGTSEPTSHAHELQACIQLKFQELVRGLDQWECWVWPSNPAAHLCCPLVVPLFRPHQVEVQVALTNWLEMALRIEVIEGIGSPSRERQERLLSVAYDLCLTHAASLPVISNFLLELLTKWNHHDHFEKVIRLLEYVGFTTLQTAHETLLSLVSRLLTGASLITWCRVVEALTAMACHWALAAHQQNNNTTPDGYSWPQQQDHERILDGLTYLTMRLEKLFLGGLLNFHVHPMVVHHTLDYYAKVDEYCEALELPVTLCPPPIITLAIVTSADLTATHRLGLALTRVKGRLATLEGMVKEGRQDPELQDLPQTTHAVKESVFFFLTGVLKGQALSESWEEKLDPFYPFDFMEEVMSRQEAQKFASVTHALPYLPLVCGALTETSRKVWREAQFEEVRDSVLADLRDLGLTGIEECSVAYA